MVSINQHLQVYTLSDLKQMASTISVKNFSKLKKDERIDAIVEKQKQPETAVYAYHYIDDASFESWESAAREGNEHFYSLEQVFGLYIMGYAAEVMEEADRYVITDTATGFVA